MLFILTITNTTSSSLNFHSFPRLFLFFPFSRMNLSELDFKKVGLSKFLLFEYCLSVFFLFFLFVSFLHFLIIVQSTDTCCLFCINHLVFAFIDCIIQPSSPAFSLPSYPLPSCPSGQFFVTQILTCTQVRIRLSDITLTMSGP